MKTFDASSSCKFVILLKPVMTEGIIRMHIAGLIQDLVLEAYSGGCFLGMLFFWTGCNEIEYLVL